MTCPRCVRRPAGAPSRVAGLLLLAVAGIVPDAQAAATFDLAVARLEGPAGATLEGLEVRLEAGRDRGTVELARLVLAGDWPPLENVSLACPSLLLATDALACRGELAFVPGRLGAHRFAVEFRHRLDGSETHLLLESRTPVPGVTLQLEAAGPEARATVTWDGLDLPALARGYAALLPLDAGLQAGSSSGRLVIRGLADAPRIAGQTCLRDVGFDTAGGTLAGAGLGLCLEIELASAAEGWRVEAEMPEPPAGEFLAGPVYLDLATVAPRLGLTLVAGPGRPLRVERLAWRDPGVGELRATARLPASGELAAVSGTLDVGSLDLGRAAQTYLASALPTLGRRLELDGALSGRVAVADGQLASARLALADTRVRDGAGAFSVTGLAGEFAYAGRAGGPGAVPASTLRWADASLYQLPLGAGEARFRAFGGTFRLLEPLGVAVLDGRLEVGTLAVAREAGSGLSIDFAAHLEPLSLEPIATALGWPPLEGRLSGAIPRVTLRDGVIEMAGALELSIFDGTVVARRLRMERLFGVLPTFAADVTLDGLDLQQMTGAFSFGAITGTLDGRIAGLRLLDWQPVAFDLDLATREPDPRRHRISQRAVDNLTSIGGGPSAALSNTFLRFFDRFGYDRLGIRCRLEDNVCRMGGVRPAPGGGYYIVEGSGLPRIDVIGHASRVDFPELVNRLVAATAAGAPTID